jgi:hypothetical protein
MFIVLAFLILISNEKKGEYKTSYQMLWLSNIYLLALENRMDR